MFKFFKKIFFKNKRIVNITQRILIHENVKKNASAYYFYQLRDGEKPEDIALKVYKNQDLFYIVMMMNDICSPMDWCMSQNELKEYIEQKYENPDAIHHFENEEGEIINENMLANPITNKEVEERLNEEKRKIKILKPEYINEFQKQMQESLR